MLLGVVAVVLIDRNRRFLVGEVTDDRVWHAALAELLDQSEVERVTELRLSMVGTWQVFLSSAVDLTGNPDERTVALQLAGLERRLARAPGIVLVLVSLSDPGDASLVPRHR